MSIGRSVFTPDVEFTDIDFNTEGRTTVFDPQSGSFVWGVFLRNSGNTSNASLEISNGENRATIDDNRNGGGGEDIERDTQWHLSTSEKLEINVTTTEGADLTETCIVIYSSE
jgi:hypothetical protein